MTLSLIWTTSACTCTREHLVVVTGFRLRRWKGQRAEMLQNGSYVSGKHVFAYTRIKEWSRFMGSQRPTIDKCRHNTFTHHLQGLSNSIYRIPKETTMVFEYHNEPLNIAPKCKGVFWKQESKSLQILPTPRHGAWWATPQCMYTALCNQQTTRILNYLSDRLP